jgi:hypothetical protein
VYRVLVGKPLGNVRLKDPEDGKITLRWFLVRYIVRMGDRISSGSCPVAGFGFSSVEPSGPAAAVSVTTLSPFCL